MKSSPSDFCLFTKGKFIFQQSKVYYLNQRLSSDNEIINKAKFGLDRRRSYSNNSFYLTERKLLFKGANREKFSLKGLEDKRTLINSKSQSSLMKPLEHYSLMPMKERLLKGQNQLILERMQKKSIMNTTRTEKPRVFLKPKQVNDNLLKRKVSAIEKRKSDLNDTDKMVFDISDYTNDNKSLNEDTNNYNLVRRYGSTPKEIDEKKQTNHSLKRDSMIRNDWLNPSFQVKTRGLSSGKLRSQNNSGNTLKVIRLLVQKYNDNIKNQQSNRESISKESTQGMNSERKGENVKNKNLQAFNCSNNNMSFAKLPKKEVFHNRFAHCKSTTDINWNSNPKQSITNKSKATKPKYLKNSLAWNYKLKDTQSDNTFSKQCLSNSQDNWANSLHLTKITNWKGYDFAWEQLQSDSHSKHNDENALIPPNPNEILLYYYYSLIHSGEENASKNSNICSKTVIQTNNDDFEYNLDFHNTNNSKQEVKIWKKALNKLIKQWHPTYMIPKLKEAKITKDLRLKLGNMAPQIMSHAKALFQHIINTFSTVLRVI